MSTSSNQGLTDLGLRPRPSTGTATMTLVIPTPQWPPAWATPLTKAGVTSENFSYHLVSKPGSLSIVPTRYTLTERLCHRGQAHPIFHLLFS